MSQTQITVGLPSTRTDGTALALTDLASIAITKNGAAFKTIPAPFVSATVGAVDPAPDPGLTDTYAVTVTDTNGNVSAPATASVNVPSVAPPNAPTISATFQP